MIPKHTIRTIFSHTQLKTSSATDGVSPQSPDLSITESVRDYMRREKQMSPTQSTGLSWTHLQEGNSAVSLSVVQSTKLQLITKKKKNISCSNFVE